MKHRFAALAALTLIASLPAAANELTAAQQAAMAPLSGFDGTWRGPAKVLQRSGQQIEITQTERVGPMLGGSLRVIEGRGYAADGTLHFNALGVISYNPATKAYNFRSYAEGHEGDFPMEVQPDGFAWTIKAGPATIRYVATVKDGVWTEVGERLMEGRPPVRIFEMSLKRVGATDWPAGGAMTPN